MKIPKRGCTAEFTKLAVKRLQDRQRISAVVKELGLGDQSLRHWVRAAAEGKLDGAGNRVVTWKTWRFQGGG